MKFRYVVTSLTILCFLIYSCGDNTTVTGGDDDPANGDPAFEFNHELNPGQSALDLLRDDDFDELVLEVDYMEGFRPTDRSLDSLKTFLERRLNKTAITILEPTEIPAGGQDSYTAAEIRNLEREHRDSFSSEGLIATYFIVTDGEFEEENVLGIAHFNTSMALFGKTINDASSDIGPPARHTIETIVMRHEFGHIMGLVNNGVDMQQDHQDTEHGNHCTVEDCLMYFSVRTTNFFVSDLFGGEIPQLEHFCRDDLADAGGKK